MMRAAVLLLFILLWMKLALSYSLKTADGVAYSIYQITDVLMLGCFIGYFTIRGIVREYWFFFATFVVILMFNSLTYFFNDIKLINQLTLSLKLIMPLLFFVMLYDSLRYSEKMTVNLANLTLLLVLLLTVLGFFFFQSEKNRLDSWWPAYFSGLHTTSYIWVAAMLLWLTQIKHPGYSLGIISVSFCMLFWGWGVRTATLALLVYLFMFYIWGRLNAKWKPALASCLVICFTLILVVLLNNSNLFHIVDQYSSGRLSMYTFKFQTVFDGGLTPFFWGGGAGADLVYTDIWWWDKKGSHNDYLTIFFEQGIIYFLTLIYLIKKMFNWLDYRQSRAIFSVYIFSSLVSNGFMLRPLPTYVLMLALVISCRVHLSAEKK